MNTQTQILIIVFIITLALLVRNFFKVIFKDRQYKNEMKRQSQLSFNKNEKNHIPSGKKAKDKEAAEIYDLIKKLSNPFEKTIFKKYRVIEKPSFTYKLRFTGWDAYTPNLVSFLSLNIFVCIAVGALGTIISMSAHSFLPLIVMETLAIILPTILLNNTFTQKSEALFFGFPDFIRIVEGYLIAGMSFPIAVQESIPYVADEWKPFLKQFVLDCDLLSQEEALDNLKYSIPNFEIKEFISLVRLNMEQGINVKECFDNQSDRIAAMQRTVMLGKIKKREMMGVLIQAPLLISIFVAFGLPLVDSFSKIGL